MLKERTLIAIVDDHHLMRECTRFRLSRLGYTVYSEAQNGQHFLDQLAEGLVPDVCILDINMPVMDGIQTASRLQEAWPRVKIIFQSMANERSIERRALQVGGRGYVVKDGPLEELAKALSAATFKEDPVLLS